MLHSLPALTRVVVVNRPSKQIKSPYVADVQLEDGTMVLCHTPGLGCSGLVASQRIIYVSRSSNPDSKTKYTAQISVCEDDEGIYYVGIHPMVSQHVASKLLHHISTEAIWASEVKINEHTRLDFVGTLNNKKIYAEVKNAMISLSTKKRSERRAIFPEGYRKSLNDTVSPRAVKHAETLTELMSHSDTLACYLVFIVPRNDCCDGLELNHLDPIYCRAVMNAIKAGVQVRVFGLNFQVDGSIDFMKRLNFYIP
jgi:DNA-binding sugar fermentation-stimulating protein